MAFERGIILFAPGGIRVEPRHQPQHVDKLLRLGGLGFLRVQRLYDRENANQRNEKMARSVFHVITVYRVLRADFVRAFFAFGANFWSGNQCVLAAPRVGIWLSLQFRSRDAKSLTSKMKMLRTIRGIFWVVLFFVLLHPTWAKDERSIKDLAKALTKLAPD